MDVRAGRRGRKGRERDETGRDGGTGADSDSDDDDDDDDDNPDEFPLSLRPKVTSCRCNVCGHTGNKDALHAIQLRAIDESERLLAVYGSGARTPQQVKDEFEPFLREMTGVLHPSHAVLFNLLLPLVNVTSALREWKLKMEFCKKVVEMAGQCKTDRQDEQTAGPEGERCVTGVASVCCSLLLCFDTCFSFVRREMLPSSLPAYVQLLRNSRQCASRAAQTGCQRRVRAHTQRQRLAVPADASLSLFLVCACASVCFSSLSSSSLLLLSLLCRSTCSACPKSW